MKSLLLVITLLFSVNTLAQFINPMTFKNTQKEKKAVIAYIKEKVHKTYCEGALDMCQATTLRMMEKTNLDAFKKLTQAKDKGIMSRVIKDYCDGAIDMCDYTTLNMMYQQNLSAKTKELTW